MRDFTMDEIKAICDAARLPMGIPFIDSRLEEYAVKYAGKHIYYAALRDITKAIQPGLVLELGTWTGTSAACLAAGCPTAEIITIDHHSDPGDDVNKDKTMEACAEFRNITYLQGVTCDIVHKVKPEAQAAFPKFLQALNDRTVDLLFLDSWHDAQYAQADWDVYSPYLSPGALVICDDIYGGDCATLIGMLGWWNQLPGEGKYLENRIHTGYPMGIMKHKGTA